MLNFGNKEFRNLQEQVLQNARDIATLKGVENLKIVIVEELPETGNPNYIYLVPNEDGEESNVYNEYIWLADEEAYEQIGAVNIDLTNYVTTDTDQTISGNKTISGNLYFGSNNARIYSNSGILTAYGGNDGVFQINSLIQSYAIRPNTNNTYDLGSSALKWKDFYLNGFAHFGSSDFNFGIFDANTWILKKGTINLLYGDTGNLYIETSLFPKSNSTCTLGNASRKWQHIYVDQNISDGTNNITVANIASKVVSSFISGTFDANGESTIDISGGEPEGLFIFTYGNCQCLMRLTATMVQNADLTPIRVACPMIYNSNPASGWLNITRSSDTLTISVIDGTNHVDSGYAWTLVKTGLI